MQHFVDKLTANAIFLRITLEVCQLGSQLKPFWGERSQGFQIQLFLLEGRAFLPLPAVQTSLTFTYIQIK